MSIPGSASPLFFGAGAAEAAAFALQKSVRFNSADSANLSRTPSSSGNRKTWTFSCWFKKSSSYSDSGYQTIFGVGESASTTIMEIGFDSIDQLRLGDFTSGGATIETDNIQMRDYSSWTHLVVKYDTTQSTATDRVFIYLNGVDVTKKSATFPAQNRDSSFNHTLIHVIGARQSSSTNHFDGYIADVYMIDGTALDATSFGAYDDNGVWQAAAYSGGSFGTNGFHLFDFANESGIGSDSSGNDNDFTVNNLTATGGAVNYLNNITGGGSYNDRAFSPSYISNYVNTSTWAITNTAWAGAWDSSGNTNVFTPSGGIAVSSSLIVYYGNYNNLAATTTLTITYTDSSTETDTFTSGSSNWMGSFTASNAAGKTIQSIKIVGPSGAYQSFGGFVIDGQILTSANADTDILRDSPTNGSTDDDTGAGGEVSGNYCTWNPLVKNRPGGTTSFNFKNGNLEVHNVSGAYGVALGTIPMSSGKWYWEVTVDGTPSNSYDFIGIIASDSEPNYPTQTTSMPNQLWYRSGGTKHDGTTSTSYGATYGDGDVIGIALDLDSATTTLTFYKNGTSQGTAFSSLASGKSWLCAVGDYSSALTTTSWIANWGQRSFAYSAPSGYKALCTTNLPTPTIADGSEYFQASLWTGTGAARSITTTGMSPDFVWIKMRSGSYHNVVFDSVRGATYRLNTNLTNAEDTGAGVGVVSSFNSDGFSLDGGGGNVNQSSGSYVGWAWDAGSSTVSNTDGSITSSVRASATSGFSIVSWSGSGANATIGHGLNAAPEFIMLKDRDYISSWYIYHKKVGNNKYLSFDTGGPYTNPNAWNSTDPTSSVFTVISNVNSSGSDLIAYCFAPVAGYSAFGEFTSNNTTDNVFLYTGFAPRYILWRITNTSGGWSIYDAARTPVNPNDTYLRANSADAEATATPGVIDFLSNGFKVRNTLGGTNSLIYMAFASNPFQANGGLAR